MLNNSIIATMKRLTGCSCWLFLLLYAATGKFYIKGPSYPADEDQVPYKRYY